MYLLVKLGRHSFLSTDRDGQRVSQRSQPIAHYSNSDHFGNSYNSKCPLPYSTGLTDCCYTSKNWLKTYCFLQRWASTLANRSNARHRSNIRAPPRPLPYDECIQSVGICVARGAGSDSQLAGVSGCHIFVPAPLAPPPKGIGQKSKVVILPTTGFLLKQKMQIAVQMQMQVHIVSFTSNRIGCIKPKGDHVIVNTQ